VLNVNTLKKRKDFQRISARCQKYLMPAFILQVADNPEPTSDSVRIGYTASRRVGGAVQRNRAKRRLRELVRQTFPEQADSRFDYVLIAKTTCISRNFEKLRNELISVLARHRGAQHD
jgi:ribonuclease P protein component